MSHRALDHLRETAMRAKERERLTGNPCPVTIQKPQTVLALVELFDEAYKLAALCEDARDMRMGGVDPESPQVVELHHAVDKQVIATARAADRIAEQTPPTTEPQP